MPGDEVDTIIVEMPPDSWRLFPDGKALGAEMQRRAEAAAADLGRQVEGLASVETRQGRSVYIGTFRLKAPT